MTSTKLDRVEVENYRAIGRLVIDLDELTTVIGEHDCGKSSLLRAIAAVLDPALGDGIPQFDGADFHRPFEPGSERTSELSITLSVAKDRLRVRVRPVAAATIPEKPPPPRRTVGLPPPRNRAVGAAVSSLSR